MSNHLPRRTPLRTFTNDKGRTFAVRILPPFARYGRNNVLRADEGALVEFYDTTLADDTAGQAEGFGPLGQFVSRYFLDTLLGRDGYGKATGGLCLDGGNAEVWSIDAATMDAVRVWLAGHAQGGGLSA